MVVIVVLVFLYLVVMVVVVVVFLEVEVLVFLEKIFDVGSIVVGVVVILGVFNFWGFDIIVFGDLE